MMKWYEKVDLTFLFGHGISYQEIAQMEAIFSSGDMNQIPESAAENHQGSCGIEGEG